MPPPVISAFDIAAGLRLVTGVPHHLHHRLSADLAAARVRQRIRQRPEHLLRQLRRILAADGPGIYRELMRWAGCEYGDVASLVRTDGLEGALGALLRAGVFLQVDELKGLRPIVRGSQTLSSDRPQVSNPRTRPMIPMQSSGSSGPATQVFFDLGFVRDTATTMLTYIDARGGTAWRKAIWASPGAAAQYSALIWSTFGEPLDHWFTQVRDDDPGLHPRYRWSTRAIVATSRLTPAPIPPPELVPLTDPRPIVEWLHATLQSGHVPFLRCFASAAVALCQHARELGLDICGSQLITNGEPLTPTRLAQIRLAGVTALSSYGSAETGALGHGCEHGVEADDMHLFTDLVAMIQPPTPPEQAAPLYVTTLSPHAPNLLLNVHLGDSAVLERRGCSCPVGEVGWDTHLHTIRSTDKLTAGGGSLLDLQLDRILEEVLPRTFGGSALDYQLVEEESPDGRPLVRLLVAPAVGELDVDAVATAFRAEVAAAGGAQHILMRIWESGQTIRVERRDPYTTRSGKILHVFKARLAAQTDPHS